MTWEEIRGERERVFVEVDLREADLGEMMKEENKAAESDGDERGSAPEIVLQDYRLKRTKAEMGKVIEENQRLKMHLERILKDYRALQMQYQDFVKQEPKKSSSASAVNIHHNTERSELISLSLGRSSSNVDRKNDETYSISKRKVEEEDKANLALGLACKFKVPKTTPAESSMSHPSPENGIEEVKKEAIEIWPPNKFPNTARNREDEVSLQNLTKRARVSVRVRCDTPTKDDGCRWRKYGQKISNPCPRAYCRCTVAPSCPVRKQVQRCADDMSILITTYEGTHNHPLPVSAAALASTTSAAASMLISGSKTSILGTKFNGLNFYCPNSPISYSPLCPSITLDLTSTSFSSSSLSRPSRLPNFTLKHSTTNLNFSSWDTNAFPISWTNGIHQYCSNKNQICSFNLEEQPQETLHRKSLSSQDTIAAALTSVIGSGSAQQGNQSLADNKSSQNIKSGEPFPVLSSFLSAANANKYAPNFLNKLHDRDHFI